MTPPVYLATNPPARRQFRLARRVPPFDTIPVVTAICVHTAENLRDTDGPDMGAENVARFIANRTDGPGSYHSIVDSDSIIHLCEYRWEAYGERTGGNRWTLHLSFAMRAEDWPADPHQPGDERIEAALRNGALEAVRMIRWVARTHEVTIPTEPITAEQYRHGQPGITSHAELDPGRRSDPGDRFPWRRWLHMIRTALGEPMPNDQWTTEQWVEDWQRKLKAHGADLGTSGPNADGIDGVFGQLSNEAGTAILRTIERLAGPEAANANDAALGALTRDLLDTYQEQQP
jgi:hypothetical protein